MKAIACVDQKTLALGYQGNLIFKCKEDMAHFKSHTIGKMVVMGAKTYESIGGGLKGRFNIVITSQPEKYKDKNDAVFLRYYQFLCVIGMMEDTDSVFVIGGEYLFNSLLQYCDTIYLTEVIRPENAKIEYDTSFPSEIKDKTLWSKIHYGGRKIKGPFSWTNENGEEETCEVYYTFATYKKLNKKKNNRRIGG